MHKVLFSLTPVLCYPIQTLHFGQAWLLIPCLSLPNCPLPIGTTLTSSAPVQILSISQSLTLIDAWGVNVTRDMLPYLNFYGKDVPPSFSGLRSDCLSLFPFFPQYDYKLSKSRTMFDTSIILLVPRQVKIQQILVDWFIAMGISLIKPGRRS